MSDAITLLFEMGLGPWCIPLRGKIPVLDSWESLEPVDEQRVRDWLGLSYNIGFRTGVKSGLVVLDDDQARNNASGFVAPPTGLIARTPTGGRHFFYRSPGPLGNSASKLAPYVDVRADGGQVVCVPSIHPVARQPYVWESTSEPGHLPPEIIARLHADHPAPSPAAQISVSPQTLNTGTGYAAAALHREAHRVRTAAEGTRNGTLNEAAFNLGQLVAGGALDQGQATAALAEAASICGLPETEARKTIASGLRGGAKAPRRAPERGPSPRVTVTTAAPAPPPRTKPDVLVPGSHQTEKDYIEQSGDKFAADVLSSLEPGALYRRATAVGELHNGQFVQVNTNRLRSIVDEGLRLCASKTDKDSGEIKSHFRNCTQDHASVLLEYAAKRGTIRELKHIATHPVCVGDDFIPARPGWNEDSGVYLTGSLDAAPLPLPEARAVLEDLVCDFPFSTPADRANYIGLLLTVILRPAIAEPVPMHLIGSPVERTGKTKLAEIVLGCGILGRPTPAMQLGVREEEREKRITAALLAGDAVIHLDNLHDFVDSAALASLLTSSVYRGRELGHSKMLNLTNGVTIVGTGNNVSATGEISKRVVPIMLQPCTEAPETRQDYRHPLLRAYVESQRGRVVGALLGLIADWRSNGRPLGSVGFGGFERWSSVVGGIMVNAGYPEWCSNLAAWRGTSDDFGSELRAFVSAWHDAYQGWVDASDLFTLAEKHELFTRKLTQTTPHGQRVAFGQKVLSAIANRVVSGWRIEIEGSGKRRHARLVAV